MEKKPYLHEIVRPAREIGELVMGWVADLVVPPESLDEPQRGATEMLDRGLSSPRSVPPANPGDWDSLRGV